MTLQLKENAWNTLTHDFGVKQGGSIIRFEFTFSGTDNIKSVAASCGCTTSVHNKKSVQVRVRTKPINKQYYKEQPFHKTLTVFYESGLPPQILNIKGTLI